MEYFQIWAKFEIMKGQLGVEVLLDDLAQALSYDELEDLLRFIDKTRDLNIF